MRTTAMAMAMAAQDKDHEKMAQETSSMSLGPQVSFFFLLHFVFVLLTNILGTSYLQG
jgi:hypothetical protein